jgi:DNA-binding NarL/FixJ family response regulator
MPRLQGTAAPARMASVITPLEAVLAHPVVILRLFSGMSSPEVAEHLGLSVRTVDADWAHARAWLTRALSDRQQEASEE